MPFTIIRQTLANGAVTGGPVIPTPTHPLIKSSYINLDPTETYICNFESSRELTLSGLSGVTLTTTDEKISDHGMVASPENSLTAFTASVDGSKSGYFIAVGMLLKN